MNFTIIIFFAILTSMVGVIILALKSILKQGDERRKFIINKTICNTFFIIIGMLLIYIIEYIYSSIVNDVSTKGINPFILTFIISIIFLFQLLYTKKKYGD